MDISSEDNLSSEDDSTSNREGRFQGHAYSWTRYTADDRALARSLIDEEASDLGRHLYNVHAIKAIDYDPSEATGPASIHKKTWSKKPTESAPSWVPSQAWTAWPVNTTDLPSLEERHGNQGRPMKVGSVSCDSQPSTQLQSKLRDELLALILRQAKLQIAQINRSRAPQGMKVEHKPDLQSGKDDKLSSKNAFNGDDHRMLQIFTDDAQSEAILSPEIDNIVSQFDRLLLALHSSRRGQTMLVHPHDMRKQARKQTSSAAASVVAEPVSDSDTPSRSELPTPEHSSDAEEETTTGQIAVKFPRLNTRDWSEVLGIAGMSGWNMEVIRSATDRCRSLFGEEMIWPAVMSNVSPQQAPLYEHDASAAGQGFWKALHLCPVKGCPRAAQSIKGLASLQQHLRRAHSWDDTALADYSPVPFRPALKIEAIADTHERAGTAESYLEDAARELLRAKKRKIAEADLAS